MKIKLTAIFPVLILLTVAFSKSAWSHSINDFYESATEAQLSERLDKFPDDREALLRRGRLRASTGRFDEAIEDFQRVRAELFISTGPLRDLGLAYLGNGDEKRGFDLLHRAYQFGDVEAGDELRKRGVKPKASWTPISLFVFDMQWFPRTPHVKGIATGFGSEVSTLWGVQASVGVGAARAYGIQAGAFVAMADRLHGWQIGLVTVTGGRPIHPWPSYGKELRRSVGIQTGGVAISEHLDGVQIAAIAVGERIHGLQLSALNGAPNMKGLQVGFVNVSERLSAVQCGIMNWVEANDEQRVHRGVQFGFHNTVHGHFKGLQIGAFNVAYQLTGVQIGFLNRVARPTHLPQYMPVVNASW